MGSGVGPRLPITGMKFLVDPRNAVSVTASQVKDYITQATSTLTSYAVSSTGNSTGLLGSLSTSAINFGATSSLNITSSLSISAWVFPVSFGIGNSVGRIIDKSTSSFPFYGYRLNLDNNTRTLALVYNCGNTVTSTGGYFNNLVEINKWQHFVVSHSGTTATFYKNGVSIGSSSSISAPTYSGTVNMMVGNNSAGTNAFDGKIGALRIYDKALSASEVSQIYNSTKGKYL